MESLVRDVVQADPTERPDMEEYDRAWDTIGSWTTRKIHLNNSLEFVVHWMRRVAFVARGIPPTPA